MPSSQLSLLCDQIEKQDTDHFGKFYMYVSLLNTVAVRNKSFVDSLPKYSSGLAFWQNDKLKIGELPVEFTQQLSLYAREFANTQPNFSKMLSNIALLYVRKGKISDLIHIIDKMLSHLSAIHPPQSHNQNIYEYIHFDDKKAALVTFIEQISAFNQQLLSIVDNGVNTAISGVVAATGVVLVIASIFSVIPGIIGLGLLIGGGLAAYHYASQLEAQAEQLKNQMEQIAEKVQQLPQDESLFGDKNYRSFYAAAIKPLPYAALTAAEQLMFDPEQKKSLEEPRKGMDEIFTALSI